MDVACTPRHSAPVTTPASQPPQTEICPPTSQPQAPLEPESPPAPVSPALPAAKVPALPPVAPVSPAEPPTEVPLAPALSPHERFIKYFGTLFCHDDERPYAERLTQRLEEGAAAVIVQPRGPLETLRAREILEQAGPLEMVHHDLAHQSWEYAAARHERPWIRAFWTDSAHGADCLYCRLFERPSH